MDFTANNPLPEVKVKNSVKIFTKSGSIVNQIIQHIKSISNYQDLRGDLELLQYVCQMVEEMVKNGNSDKTLKVDKKSLVLDIFIQLFGLMEPEINALAKHVEYLIINKIVKKKIFIKLLDYAKTKLKSLQK